MKTLFHTKAVSPLLLLAATANSAVSMAQEQEQATVPVEEMVVTGKYIVSDQIDTATGLGLSLYETPQSVSIITKQRIEDQNLGSLTDVIENAAGVSSKNQDSARSSYSARGFAIQNYQLDGVPIAWQSGFNAGETQSDLSLYERVEVVRGATGLLTGVGNPSASINLVRKHATSRDLTGQLSASYGRWNTYGAMADVATGLNESGSVRGRVVVNYEEGDSFRDYAGEKKSVIYGVLEADVTRSSLLRVGASYQDNDPTATSWGGLPVWHSDGSRTDWRRSKTTAAKWTSWGSTVKNYYVDWEQQLGDGWLLKLNVNQSINAADDQLLLYLSGTPDKNTGLGLNASPRKANTERKQTSFSAQVTGEYSLFGQLHDLTIGAITTNEDAFAESYARSNVAPVGNFNHWDGNYPQPTWGNKKTDVETTTKQQGLYAATRLSLSEKTKLILGGRLADWERTGTYYNKDVDFGDTEFIPYAGLLYSFTPNQTAYLSYTDIFLPQENRDKNNRLLDPVRGRSYELGLKSLYFQSLLQTNIAIFSIQQDNLAQVDPGQVIIGVPNSQAYVAADGATSEGVELELTGQLAQGWDMSASYTYFRAEDDDGNAVNTQQPRQLLKLYTSYQFDGALRKLMIGGGVNWQGANYTATKNMATGRAERIGQESYSLVSAMARYQFTPAFSAQLNIDNALDKTYYSQIGFYNQLAFGQPRNVTASVSYQF